ncbi:MAG: hypothetical protein ABI266_10085 [Ginsengibacter sp.]
MEYKGGKKIFKRILIVFIALTIITVVHVYWVTRPKIADKNTIVMARIDITSPMNQNDADSIQTWLYNQKGINRVLVNPETKIAIFTFYPVSTSADQVVHNFQTSFNYTSKRYVPTKEELDRGWCPALPASVTEKISAFVKKTF